MLGYRLRRPLYLRGIWRGQIGCLQQVEHAVDDATRTRIMKFELIKRLQELSLSLSLTSTPTTCSSSAVHVAWVGLTKSAMQAMYVSKTVHFALTQ